MDKSADTMYRNDSWTQSHQRVNASMHTFPDPDPPPSGARKFKEGLFLCRTCSKGFTRPTSLASHELLHTGERSFVCETCNKTFLQAKSLHRHKRLHTAERRFACATCDKRFKNSSDLRIHERIHTDERQFECVTCRKKFKRSSALNAHMLTHSAERPFVCPTCNKTFQRLSHLQRHERDHAGPESKYDCTTCEKKFSKASYLREHQLIHTGERRFVCGTCGKGLTTASALRSHEYIKHGTADADGTLYTFVCDTCEKRFRHSSRLRRHLLLHTGERPFVCRICDKAFTQLSALNTHERLKHEITHVDQRRSISRTRDKKLSVSLSSGGRGDKRSDRKYVCDNCDEGFVDKSSLSRHSQFVCRKDALLAVKKKKKNKIIGHVTRAGGLGNTHSACEQLFTERRNAFEEYTLEAQCFGCGHCGEMFNTRDEAKECYYAHSHNN